MRPNECLKRSIAKLLELLCANSVVFGREMLHDGKRKSRSINLPGYAPAREFDESLRTDLPDRYAANKIDSEHAMHIVDGKPK